ncbi:DNA-binding protein [Lysobacter korlensis]|uniref:DNA-binding protein n=1 Tax=Lysobacter korlensis TaxID=553636 RepID=A0ABV6RR21_9GAMM
MARGITQNDVDQAADALLLAGERPTVDRIRQHLGTGSPNTVTRMLDLWWKALGPRLSAQQRKVELPAAPEPVAALASQLWEQALACARDDADTAIAAEREALARAREAAEERISAAESATVTAREAEARAAQALATAHQRLDDRQALVDRQSAQIDDLSRQRDEAVKLGQQLQAEVLALRERLQALQAEHESAREAQAAHLRAVEDRAHVEVDRARQETRELKQQLHAADKAHAGRVRQLEFDLSQVQTGSAQLARELAAEQARRETLEAQQTELRRSLDAALKPAPALRTARTRTKAKPVRPKKR